MNEDRLIRIEDKLDGLITNVAGLKASSATLQTLQTSVGRLQGAVGSLTDRVSALETSVSEVGAGVDGMTAEVHRLGVLQEAAHADARVPFESDEGLREHMDREFELTRREFREALAPLTLSIRAHTEQLNARHNL